MDTSNTAYPLYGDLPVAAGTVMRHAWDVFGRQDLIGTLNFLSPARRRAALAYARTGETVNLSLPLDHPSTPPFGRERLTHEVYAANDFSWSDRITALDTQSSSQWDGLLHVSHSSHGFYGGRPGPANRATELGIDSWARSGIVGRGVLVDVAHHLGSADPLSGRAVSSDELTRMLDDQGTELRPGDILCLRFGWLEKYRTLDSTEQERFMLRPTCDGLSAAEDTAALLWDRQVAALVSDNPTIEAQPGNRDQGFLHHRLITMLGMPLGELFDLHDLAERCRASGQWEFLFVSVPLNLPGGAGSPANAIAVL